VRYLKKSCPEQEVFEKKKQDTWFNISIFVLGLHGLRLESEAQIRTGTCGQNAIIHKSCATFPLKEILVKWPMMFFLCRWGGETFLRSNMPDSGASMLGNRLQYFISNFWSISSAIFGFFLQQFLDYMASSLRFFLIGPSHENVTG
jgi:hypothetical protein